MQQININELKPHPRNNEFFDDITGSNWEQFIDSMRERIKKGKAGNVEPIVITQDKVIVSGHQRVRGLQKLGIQQVNAEIKIYESEDEILADLIETNIRQRGIGNPNPMKLGRCRKELERIYGIKNGGDRGNQYKEADSNNYNLPTQSELAERLGISISSLQNYKKLTEMIPELEELVDTGVTTPTTALAIMKNLSEEEQLKLISSLDTTKKITQKQIQKYLDEIRELKSNPQNPEDYEYTKKQLNDYRFDYQQLKTQFDEKVKELQDLRKQLETMNNNSPITQYEKKLKDSTLLFCSKIATFIEQVGGYIWLTDKINEIPELEREGYIRSVHVIKSWADTMEYNINNKKENDIKKVH